MFSTRRLAKRSIVGTRVCAPWTDDRFYPGFIQSTQTWPNGEDVYTVQFDDGYTKVCKDSEIIGPGFQNVSIAKLKKGQKVYLTHNGREIYGNVIRHDRQKDEVLIDIMDEIELVRKLDEVRLLESRKSARLQDQDTDYSRLADLQVHSEPPKKRAVSSVIDVPAAKQRRHRDSTSSSPEDREEENMEDQEDHDLGGSSSRAGGVMNAHMAAMVLTSLSCSPVSPGPFPQTLNDKVLSGNSPGGTTGSSVGSSGVWGMKGETSTSSGSPSPPQFQISSSVPSTTGFGSTTMTQDDEGLELDDSSYFSDDVGPRKKRASVKTVFKCMWPGCGKILNTNQAIEKHVRQCHLSPKDDSDVSDHEEEFYYQEVEVTVDTVTQTFADMYTSSPPQLSFIDTAGVATKPPSDHDYQKKEPKSMPLNIPLSGSHKTDTFNFAHGGSFPMTSELSQGQMSRSWQYSQGSVKSSKSHDRLSQFNKSHSLSTSPKNSPMHKKSRSDVKKCRKVYGMENRDMWCTQCKWKKACTRFMD